MDVVRGGVPQSGSLTPIGGEGTAFPYTFPKYCIFTFPTQLRASKQQ